MMISKKILTVFCLLVATIVSAQRYEVSSPDGALTLEVSASETLTFAVKHGEKVAIQSAEVGIDINHVKYPAGAPKKVEQSSLEEELVFVVPNKDKTIVNAYNELKLNYKNGFAVSFRVFNDGVAYRFETSIKGKEAKVYDEVLALDFGAGATSYFPEEKSKYSHFEQQYVYQAIDTIAAGKFCAMPVRFDANQVGVLVTEADLYDYPCLFLEKQGNGTFRSDFSKYVLGIKPHEKHSDRYEVITEEADYHAKTSTKRNYPWRVFVISDDDRTFVESNLVMQLSSPNRLTETDWIKPGKIAWDWYNANNVYGVDFKAGINNDTYKYYIDFASEYNLEYVILDEGWTKSTTEVMASCPEIDIPELVVYAKERNVKLILWLLWHPLDKNMEDILQLYSDWGVAGIKVDFMQRADQYMVNSYENIARECAERKLLVDFHGAFKPAGLRRAYPNVMTYEGVLGNENNKWSDHIDPEHTVTLPFMRMVCGPMDFTPGAMRNAQPRSFFDSFYRPMSLGTRAHQIAMYVVYESPLQMLCDAPSAYLKEPEVTSFIAKMPAVWDETIVLEGKIGDYIAIARKKDSSWYVGVMTDENARAIDLKLDFLPAGKYSMELIKDGINAETFAEDYIQETKEISSGETIKVDMVTGGGWSAIITPLD